LLDPTPCSQNSPPIETGFPTCWLSSSLAHQGCSAPTHAHFKLCVQHSHAVMQAIRLHDIPSWGHWYHNPGTCCHIPGTVASHPRDIDITSQGHRYHIPGTSISHPRDVGITSQEHWHKTVVPICRNKLCHRNLDPTPPFPPGTQWLGMQAIAQIALSNLHLLSAICTLQAHTTSGNLSHLPAVERHFVSP